MNRGRFLKCAGLCLLIFLALNGNITVVHAMAAWNVLAYSGENYIGVSYKAALLADHIPNTGWMLIFGENMLTHDNYVNQHFVDLMIKGGWASIYNDSLCASGFPPVKRTLPKFTIQFGLDDYQNHHDIAAWSRDPSLFPRMFTNIDSTDPSAPDKIMAEYQVTKGGSLEGREIEVSFVRAELTTLPRNKNYFSAPDNGCKPDSQADIVFRHWIATLEVPSLSVNSSVDFYTNPEDSDYILSGSTLNFMWENPGPNPPSPKDHYKVIVYDPMVETISGQWQKATKFLVDYYTPMKQLPLDSKGQLIGGYRKVTYNGFPAIEASFGYGYTDYVTDGDPTNYEPTDATKGIIDLSTPPSTMTVSYSIQGDGLPSAPPVFNYVLSGVSEKYRTYSLTATPTTIDVDSGSSWSVTPNPLIGSTSTQQWYADPSTLTGTASSTTIVFKFYNQYYLTMITKGPGTVSPITGWFNAGSKVTIIATPDVGSTFKSWKGAGKGSYTGTKTSATITMNAAIKETATFI